MELSDKILIEIERQSNSNEEYRLILKGAIIALHEFNQGGKDEQTTFRCHNHTRNLANRIADRDESRDGAEQDQDI